ncbi:hypothetical protein L207DRAFT_510943 [Hyaloscypha variabilis F]|uniref:Uncharacterized protein n=1 Tax=Hyaloscypha variabilis (strain UAMH 11265 / GT02V1 / F) TaxID=1149755 RepID=A0A2J6RW28_HYAVF|nr:hypothetical protein L207DRAFT_510943 [Hyaloscypha variabilis F]
MPRLLENPPSQGSSNPFSFVMVSQPSAERDKEVRRQVRSHAANSWRGISRAKTPRQTRLRRIVPKAELSTEQRLKSLEARGLSFLHGGEDGPHPQQPAISRAFTSATITFTQRSPSPGASPKTYLGGGRMDPFNTCSLQCNTMESFLLDHYFHTFMAKVTTIYTPNNPKDLDLKDIPRVWVSFLITDPAILSGVFLRACRTLSVVTSKQYLDRLSLKYREICIKALSSKIASLETALRTETIVMMLMLTTDEFYVGSAETMRYHIDAMRRVVKLKGGLQDTVLERLVLQLIDWNNLQCNLLAQNHGKPRRYPAVDMLTSGFPTFS